MAARLEGWQQARHRPLHTAHQLRRQRQRRRHPFRKASPLCQYRQAIPFPFDHRLLLRVRPSLNLAFRRNCIGNGFEILGEDQCDRPSCGRVASLKAEVVFCEPFFEGLSRGANIITAVGAVQNIQVCAGIHIFAQSIIILLRYDEYTLDVPTTLTQKRVAGPAYLMLAAILRDARKSALLRMRSEWFTRLPEPRDARFYLKSIPPQRCCHMRSPMVQEMRGLSAAAGMRRGAASRLAISNTSLVRVASRNWSRSRIGITKAPGPPITQSS